MNRDHEKSQSAGKAEIMTGDVIASQDYDSHRDILKNHESKSPMRLQEMSSERVGLFTSEA